MTTSSRKVHYQGHGFGRRLWSLAIAGAVTAVMVLIAAANRPTVALASADAVGIVPGVLITPAPGWTVTNRGPNWVALSNANFSAQMRVAVKPANGTDLVAILQADIDQLSGSPSAALINMKDLTAPTTKPVQGNNFQQEAFINYTATVSAPQGPVPVIGAFSELLNTSTRQTAFIDFREDGGATTQAANAGGSMVNSML